MSDELREAAQAYRKAHDLLAETHTSAQRTVVIERLNDLASAALAARPDSPTLDVERLAAALHKVYCTQNRPMHSHPWHSADAIAREYAALAAETPERPA